MVDSTRVGSRAGDGCIGDRGWGIGTSGEWRVVILSEAAAEVKDLSFQMRKRCFAAAKLPIGGGSRAASPPPSFSFCGDARLRRASPQKDE
jgi:hypothetical protein